MSYCCSIPILMIGFNRPDNIKKVFEKVREVKPKKLYIAIDGAREGKVGEKDLVEATKLAVSNIDWDCEVYRRYNTTNLGAELTISSAIRWICEENDYFICLEDDIIAPISFFKFMEEMLILYKDDSRICSVSGNNFTPLETPMGEDYFFCRYGHIWGWGSWKRECKDITIDCEIKKEHCSLSFCKQVSSSMQEAKYLQNKFTSLRKKGIGNCTWDNIVSYKRRIENKLSIVPRVNLTTNIGVEGLHARGCTKYHFVPYDEKFEVKIHPKEISCWKEFDIYHFEHHFPKQNSFIKRLINRFKRLMTSFCGRYKR